MITWLSKLLILKAKGLSPGQVLKRWNESATRESSVQGAKRTALLLLLDLPADSTQLLVHHTATFGAEGAFSNEAFANKRLATGYTPRGMPRQWQTRLTNTVDGFNLFVRYVHASHERKIRELRKKWDKSALEEAMSMSQLLASFIVELQQQHAVSTALIEEKAINPFLSGDANLELELQAAVSECKADAQPADISVFKEILAVILSKRDSKLAATGQGPRITAGELELQAFNVMMASADHDVAAFSAWRLKCSDRESAQYFQQLQHSARRQKQAREIAASVTEAGPTWLMQLEVFQKQDSANFATVSAVADKIQRLHQLSDRASIHCIAVLNCGLQRSNAESSGKFVWWHRERARSLHRSLPKPHSLLQARELAQSRTDMPDHVDKRSFKQRFAVRPGICLQDRRARETPHAAARHHPTPWWTG